MAFYNHYLLSLRVFFFTVSRQQVLSTKKTTTTLFSIAISIHGVIPIEIQ